MGKIPVPPLFSKNREFDKPKTLAFHHRDTEGTGGLLCVLRASVVNLQMIKSSSPTTTSSLLPPPSSLLPPLFSLLPPPLKENHDEANFI